MEPAATDAELLRQLSQMTTRQKIGQLFAIGIPGAELDRETCDVIRTYHFSNVSLYGQNIQTPKQVQCLNSAIQDAVFASSGTDAMITVDEEGGSASQFAFGVTRLPGNFTLGAARDPDALYAMGQALGNDLSGMGFTMLLGPVLDLCRSMDDTIIGVRSYGDDPALAAELGISFARGVNDGGCGCTFKHFPGHGDVVRINGQPCNTCTHDELLALDAYPFIRAIAAGAQCIMVGHIGLPNIEKNGAILPASVSETAIRTLLRGELHFEGVVVADGAVAPGLSHTKASLQSFQAGTDIIFHSFLSHQITVHKAVEAALLKGKFNEEELNARVLRILRLKAFLRGCRERKQELFELEKLTSLKRTIRKSVTLLRDPQGLVPLPVSLKRALIIAPQMENPGILDGNSKDIYTFGDHMALLFPMATVRRISSSPSPEDLKDLNACADQADIVIIGSENAQNHPDYLAMINRFAAQKPTIVVSLRFIAEAALIHENATLLGAFTYTNMAMEAVADVLRGRIPPLGRLPVSSLPVR